MPRSGEWKDRLKLWTAQAHILETALDLLFKVSSRKEILMEAGQEADLREQVENVTAGDPAAVKLLEQLLGRRLVEVQRLMAVLSIDAGEFSAAWAIGEEALPKQLTKLQGKTRKPQRKLRQRASDNWGREPTNEQLEALEPLADAAMADDLWAHVPKRDHVFIDNEAHPELFDGLLDEDEEEADAGSDWELVRDSLYESLTS